MDYIKANHFKRDDMNAFELLKRLHDELLSNSTHIVFDKRNLLDFHRIALYGSLIEFSGAIIVAILNNAKIGIPSLFRSMLEASVEFQNLIKDPTYLNLMEANHSAQWLKVLEEAKKDTNPYLASIAKLPNLATLIAAESDKLTILKQQGYQPLNIKDRFDRANMSDEYQSMYNFLSCDAHSNIRALISRHAEIKERDFEAVYYRDEPIESFLTTIDSACGLLINASLALHRVYQSPVISEIEVLEQELVAVRTSYVV
ncbi:MAG TPA: DUF5677 domain-containing protein [Methylobacter sp.]